MSGWKIGLIIWVCFGALLVVGAIGRPRKPITPLTAVIVLLIDALVVLAVVKA